MALSFIGPESVASNATNPSLTALSSSVGVAFWQSTADFKLYAKMVSTNGSVISVGSQNTIVNAGISSAVPVMVDTTHFLVCWGISTDVIAQVFSLDTGTGVISSVGSPTTVFSSAGSNGSALALARDGSTSNYMLYLNMGGGEGYGAVMLAATSGGVAAFTPTFFTTGNYDSVGLDFIASNKAVVVYSDSSSYQVYARTLSNAAGTITAGAEQTLTSLIHSGVGTGWNVVGLTSSKAIFSHFDNSANDPKLSLISISGDTITQAGSSIVGGQSLAGLTSSLVFSAYPEAAIPDQGIGSYFDIAGTTISQGENGVFEATTDVSSTWCRASNQYAMIHYDLDTPNETYIVMTGISLTGARFYFAPAGQPLTEKFTLPFPGVRPGGMTLNRTLGTVVIGSDAPSNEPVVYSVYPYTTGTATYDGFPTGSSIQSLKWI